MHRNDMPGRSYRRRPMKTLLAGAALAAMVAAAPAALKPAGAAQDPEARPDNTVANRRVQNLSLPASGAARVNIDVPFGSVRIFTDSPDAVRVRAVRSVGENASEEERRRWLDEARITIDRQGDAVVIKDVLPDAAARGGGTAASRERRSRNVSSGARLDVEIHLPPGRTLGARLGAGNLEIAGATVGDLSATVGAGRVRLAEIRPAGSEVAVEVGAGNVDLGLAALPRQRVAVQVGAGNVAVDLPNGARADVTMETGVGKTASRYPLASPARRSGGVRIGDSLSGPLNGGGGTKITLRAGTGNLRLQ